MSEHDDKSGWPGPIEVGADVAERPASAVRPLAILGGVIAGLLVLALAGEAAAAWVTAGAPLEVPVVAGLTPAAASRAIAQGGLADGRATYVVTRQFPAGLVISQTPAAGSNVARGTHVDVRIAVAPRPIVVPDLAQLPEASARSVATYQLFTPSIAYVYSKDVEIGRVIEQLPRSGDGAVTGSPLTIVVSLGPGTGGALVPSLIGHTLGEARSIAASSTLFPVARPVTAPGVADGTIVDQAPSPGSIVPVTSNVVLSVAIAQSPQKP